MDDIVRANKLERIAAFFHGSQTEGFAIFAFRISFNDLYGLFFCFATTKRQTHGGLDWECEVFSQVVIPARELLFFIVCVYDYFVEDSVGADWGAGCFIVLEVRYPNLSYSKA